MFISMRYLLLGVSLLLLNTTSMASESSYSFGIVPQQSAKQLAKRWGPVFQYIHESSGIKLRFNTAKNIPEFEKKLAKGEYDFAYMNPYHFTVFNQDPGYSALVVRRDQPIRGIVVVRKDSNIRELSDLSNTTMAFPSPAAFAASMLPRAELTKKQIPFTPKYVSSHDSVYLNVAKGIFPAGGGVKRTFNNVSPELREQLTILWVTEPYTPHSIAANPRVPSEISKKVQNAFVQMSLDKKGSELLQSLKIKNGLIAATDADWDDVRGLQLNLLDKFIK